MLTSSAAAEASREIEAPKGNSGVQMRLTSRVGSPSSDSLVTRVVRIRVNLRPDYVFHSKSRCY